MGRTQGAGARNSLWRKKRLDKNLSNRAGTRSKHLCARLPAAVPMSPALRTDPTRRACRPSWRGGCRPARSKHSLGATQLPSSKASNQTQVGLTPNAVLPAAARGRLKVVSLISRTQPGPSTSSMLGPGGAQSVPPAWMPVRHTALWLTLRPIIKHCAEMTQQSTCPPQRDNDTTRVAAKTEGTRRST